MQNRAHPSVSIFASRPRRRSKKRFFFPTRKERETRKEISPSHKNSHKNSRGREVNAAQIPPAFDAIHSRSRVHERERAEGRGGSDFKKHTTKPRVPFLPGQKIYEEVREERARQAQKNKEQ